MSSIVYFTDFRASYQESLTAKLGRLVKTAGISDVIGKRDLTAVKLHFGEKGNTAFIRPVFVSTVIDAVKECGGKPFLTDTNTLYAGTRSDTVNHLETAIKNGFAYAVVDAPLVIADGLRGLSDVAVKATGNHFDTVYIGTDIHHADVLISLAHFKGHELSGFGGALKNIGMGCASRRGKLAMHSTVSPKVIRKKCVGCGECIAHCPATAISLTDDKKAIIDENTCIGCGECIVVCAAEAVQIRWNQSVPVFLEGMMEYAWGVIREKKGKVLYVNFINNISPMCDCIAHNDVPIVPDIGMVASLDPVALDQASVDLVNREAACPGSCLTSNTGPGEDKFKGLYPQVEWELQLAYAEKLGMGTRDYTLEILKTKGIKD
ncbi:MAG: DUF362 domain-containing protein [Proteobacteria bacterium]|nr:DUF362 domain-containing protein [Pseudomonadota bacterium]